MKFIEISDGVSIRKEEIICVERIDELRSKITTEYGSYESNFSYSTILSLLEMDNVEETMANISRGNQQSNNLFGGQHWAG